MTTTRWNHENYLRLRADLVRLRPIAERFDHMHAAPTNAFDVGCVACRCAVLCGVEVVAGGPSQNERRIRDFLGCGYEDAMDLYVPRLAREAVFSAPGLVHLNDAIAHLDEIAARYGSYPEQPDLKRDGVTQLAAADRSRDAGLTPVPATTFTGDEHAFLTSIRQIATHPEAVE